jgi:hypothetical protein
MSLRFAVLGRTPIVSRTIARTVSCGGGLAEIVNNIDELVDALGRGVHFVCVAVEELETLLPVLERSSAQALVFCGQSDPAHLEWSRGSKQANHLFGLRYPDAPPRGWELLSVIRRWVNGKPPPIEAYLDWGGGGFERVPATEKDRDAIVAEVEDFVGKLVGRRPAGAMAEVAHELLMNAMYDAPVDQRGRQLFAHDRTAAIKLAPSQQPRFLCGCDGNRLVLTSVDPFGGLRKEHVFGGLARALVSGTMDKSGGGAGLGFFVIFKACTMMFFDVVPGRRTQVTAILELDVPQRELRSLPRSIHFFQQEP